MTALAARPSVPGRIDAGAGDPIWDACWRLRSAALVPFYADVADIWASRFERHVLHAARSFQSHVEQTSTPDSPLSELHRERPDLRSAIARQVEEHGTLAARFRELLSELQSLSAPDLWSMVDLRECALTLERALLRHHRRLVGVVHEAGWRDLGGG